MSRTQTMQDSAEREARSERQYASISKRIRALKASPHGMEWLTSFAENCGSRSAS